MVDMPYNPIQPNDIYLRCIYKHDLGLNYLRGLICHKLKSDQTKQTNDYRKNK